MPGLYALVEGGSEAVAAFDFSKIDFSQVTTIFTTVLGIGAATAVSIMAIKKGWRFLMGMISRA